MGVGVDVGVGVTLGLGVGVVPKHLSNGNGRSLGSFFNALNKPFWATALASGLILS